MSSSQQVGQCLLELPPPIGIAPRDPLPGLAGLPDAEEPDPVETHLGQAVQFGVRDIIQGRRPPQLAGQFRQPDARIDLIERRIAGMSGGSAFLASVRRGGVWVVSVRCGIGDALRFGGAEPAEQEGTAQGA